MSYYDYSKLLELVNDSTQGDVYNELMKKEERVLDVVARAANQNKLTTLKDTLFYNQSLVEIAIMFMNTWKNIFRELAVEHKYSDLADILWDGDRKIYTGMMFVVISLIFFFIDISG
jgi:hypothetical protein